MKKISLTTFILCISVCSLKSQWTAANPTLTSNKVGINVTSAEASLRQFTVAGDIRFTSSNNNGSVRLEAPCGQNGIAIFHNAARADVRYDGNSLKLYPNASCSGISQGIDISNSGNVGIGTTTPSTQLHTTAGVRFQGIGQNNTLSRILAQDINGNLAWRDASTMVNATNIYNSNGALSTNRQVNLNNLVLGFINGSIGIGTSSPLAQLHTTAGVRFQGLANNNSQNRILTQDNIGNLAWRDAGTITPDINIFKDDGTLSSHRQVNLNNFYLGLLNGSLGLGISTPTAQLHTMAGVRFQGLSNDNARNRIVVSDLDGNLAWRDATTLNPDINIYKDNGSLNSDRFVDMGDYNMHFQANPDLFFGSNFRISNLVPVVPNSPSTSLFNVDCSRNNDAIGASIRASSYAPNASFAVGTWNSAGSAGINAMGSYGSVSEADGDGSLFGVVGRSKKVGNQGEYNCGTSVGGYFESWGHSCTTAYDAAVEAHSWQSVIGSPLTNSFAGLFYGEVYTTGSYTTSDERIKKDIKPLLNGLDIINKLSPKTYDFKNEEFAGLSLPKKKENFGLIAQDVEKILPDFIKSIPVPKVPNGDLKTPKGIGEKTGEYVKSINYTEFIPITIAAIKELDAKVEKQNTAVIENEALKTELASVKEKLASYDEKFALLEKTISALCESGCAGLKDAGGKTNSEVNALYQSIPNPTDDVAMINYYLVKEYKDAYLTISTQDGKQVQAFKLEPKVGSGSVKMSLGSLTQGTYLYTLVAGEQVVDTKRLQIVK